jgi:hypothetical protein
MGKLKETFSEVDDLWSYLVDNELFTDAEIQLVINMMGYSTETLNDAIYARYGYRDLDQLVEEL